MSQLIHITDKKGSRIEDKPLDLDEVRAKLAETNGKTYWRSLDELSQKPGFNEMLRREFPGQAPKDWAPLPRRDFLKLMGASLALAGLSGCAFQPNEKIVPYVNQPESIVPGIASYYATAMPFAGYALGLLAKSSDGRPTKLEGNPDHPTAGGVSPVDPGKGKANFKKRGSTDVFAQASLLTMYDPERSQSIRRSGASSNWDTFTGEITAQIQASRRNSQGADFAIITETITSPTQLSLINDLRDLLPELRWVSYEPVNRDNVTAGTRLAFGRDLHPVYHFDRADVIVSLDCDFMLEEPGRVAHAREFIEGRRVTDKSARQTMNRLYVIESTSTITGAAADHRFPVKAAQVDGIARALAQAVGVQGGAGAQQVTAEQNKWVQEIAKDLTANAGKIIVVAGAHQPPAVHALAMAMTNALTASDPVPASGSITLRTGAGAIAAQTITYHAPIEGAPVPHLAGLAAVVDEMKAGKIKTVLVMGTNPAYSAPRDLEFAQAFNKVPFRAHVGLYEDETSNLCTWHVPEAHYLEQWSDARSIDGTVSIVQPIIQPLYEACKSPVEVLGALVGNVNASGYDIVRGHWARTKGLVNNGTLAAASQQGELGKNSTLTQSGASGLTSQGVNNGNAQGLSNGPMAGAQGGNASNSPVVNNAVVNGGESNGAGTKRNADAMNPTNQRGDEGQAGGAGNMGADGGGAGGPYPTTDATKSYSATGNAATNGTIDGGAMNGVTPKKPATNGAPRNSAAAQGGASRSAGGGANGGAGDAFAFDRFWQEAVHSGVVAGTAAPALNVNAGALNLPAQTVIGQGIEVNFRPDPTIWDGRFANNGWLQECPKPITKLVWDNAILVSPGTAIKNGWNNNDEIELTLNGGKVKGAVWMVPGQPDDALTLNLGGGRAQVGKIGTGAGFDANQLRTVESPWMSYGVKAVKLGSVYKLAATAQHNLISTQGKDTNMKDALLGGDNEKTKVVDDWITPQTRGKDVDGVHGRDLIRVGTFEEMQKDKLPVVEEDKIGVPISWPRNPGSQGSSLPDSQNKPARGRDESGPVAGDGSLADGMFTTEEDGRPLADNRELAGSPSFYPRESDYLASTPLRSVSAEKELEAKSAALGRDHVTQQWGMSVDLQSCVGCNACVVGCQSENNSAIVGKDQVLMGREMHWIRIDAYMSGSFENPEVYFEPMMCQHCEKAPCAPVCPFNAVMESPGGINEQIYNRCVGTKYCENNCPYKVRRFNFLQYSDQQTPTIQLMANPSVTVRSRGVMEKCTYCIQRVKAADWQAKKEDRFIRDGDIIVACQQACPTNAIVFGDINDPNSEVSKLKRGDLTFGLLTHLNTGPRTSYTAKIRNPNPALVALNPAIYGTEVRASAHQDEAEHTTENQSLVEDKGEAKH